MKRSCVDVIPRNGQYIVRIIENGETKDHTFDFELHAQAFADGQHFRLLALEAQPMVDAAEFERKPDASPLSHDRSRGPAVR
ncbi:hypothetical protein KX729_29090 [Rhizobium sp. XQZ8]|uniref:hypothetical protein n=1 Tax=Rhizobium populisoli TaxID=2859785 RepID=UPI001CA48B2F|nr:hypothetical protein [Rhizobium populisoli]MBW6425475.1 hypothetical protein [Rhizobium populisoli]